MNEKTTKKESNTVQEVKKGSGKRTKIIYYAVMGLFLVILGFLVFATLAQ